MIGAISLLLFVAFILPKIITKLTLWFHQYELVKKLPGPKGLPLVGSIVEMAGDTTTPMKFWMAEADRARARGDKIFTLNILGRILTFPLDGETAKAILESNEELAKGRDYEFLRAWLGSGTLLGVGEQWKIRRKAITPPFHFAMLDGYIEKFNKHTRLFIELLHRKEGKEINMSYPIKCCTIDVICDTVMGCDFAAQMNDDCPYIHAVEEYSHLEQRYTNEPQMWIGPIWAIFYHRRFMRALNNLKAMSREVIMHRLHAIKTGEVEVDPRRKLLIDVLMEEMDKGKMDFTEFQNEIDSAIFGGHDTVSTSLEWIFWSLATNPHIQEKAYQEVKEVFGDSDRDCSKDDIAKLVYLERCIKESMRIFATVPLLERWLKNDFKLGDHLIPRDTELFVSPMILHHNSQVYENHWEFNPDNFLPEKIEQRSCYDYIPFSAGPKNCLGQKFAMHEMKVIMSWVLRNFKISSDKDMRYPGLATEVVLRPVEDLRVTLTARS